MEIKQLEIFLTLSRLCNFTQTAKELNYAQSNISAQIQKLEEEFGSPLFDRIGHKVVLTKSGQNLIPYAQQIIALSTHAKEQIIHPEKKRLCVAASESLCIYQIPQLFRRYKKDYPEVELFLQMVNTEHYDELLSQNSVDLAFVLDAPVNQTHLINHISNLVPVGLFSVPEHPIVKRKSLSLEQLSGERFILTGPGCCYRTQFEQLMQDIPYTIALETSSLQSIKELTLSGFGICLLPVMAVQRELQQHQLVQLPISLDIAVYSQLLLHKDKWISPEVHAFLELFA